MGDQNRLPGIGPTPPDSRHRRWRSFLRRQRPRSIGRMLRGSTRSLTGTGHKTKYGRTNRCNWRWAKPQRREGRKRRSRGRREPTMLASNRSTLLKRCQPSSRRMERKESDGGQTDSRGNRRKRPRSRESMRTFSSYGGNSIRRIRRSMKKTRGERQKTRLRS